MAKHKVNILIHFRKMHYYIYIKLRDFYFLNHNHMTNNWWHCYKFCKDKRMEYIHRHFNIFLIQNFRINMISKYLNLYRSHRVGHKVNRFSHLNNILKYKGTFNHHSRKTFPLNTYNYQLRQVFFLKLFPIRK